MTSTRHNKLLVAALTLITMNMAIVSSAWAKCPYDLTGCNGSPYAAAGAGAVIVNADIDKILQMQGWDAPVLAYGTPGGTETKINMNTSFGQKIQITGS